MLNQECPCCGFHASALLHCDCSVEDVAAAVAVAEAEAKAKAAEAAAEAAEAMAMAEAAAAAKLEGFRKKAESEGFALGPKLGQGESGIVFRATKDGCTGALKFSNASGLEASAYQVLDNHPNTPRFYGSGEGWLFIEEIQGREALDLLEYQQGEEVAGRIARETGVQNLDLNWGNIRFAPDGRIVILDWVVWRAVRP